MNALSLAHHDLAVTDHAPSWPANLPALHDLVEGEAMGLRIGQSTPNVALAVYLRNLFIQAGMHREHFHAVFLDANRTFLDECTLITGTRDGFSVRMRQLFASALNVDSKVMVIAHNHPSGLCHPSARDISATNQIAQFAAAVDIALLDHLIITPTRAYSMRAGGLL